MNYFLIIFGGAIILYTLVAYYFGFPQLYDLLPLGFFDGKSDEEFYKVVPSDKPDKGPWIAIGLGVALILLGLYIKYVLRR
jgi:hypothetical protein